jgi:hypothetical protein
VAWMAVSTLKSFWAAGVEEDSDPRDSDSERSPICVWGRARSHWIGLSPSPCSMKQTATIDRRAESKGSSGLDQSGFATPFSNASRSCRKRVEHRLICESVLSRPLVTSSDTVCSLLACARSNISNILYIVRKLLSNSSSTTSPVLQDAQVRSLLRCLLTSISLTPALI